MQKCLRFSEEVLQAELNESRRDRALRDDAERGRPEGRPGVCKLRMVKSVIELHAKCEFRVFPYASHRGPLADREIGVELSRSGDDVQAGITVSRRTVGPHHRRWTDHGRDIEP